MLCAVHEAMAEATNKRSLDPQNRKETVPLPHQPMCCASAVDVVPNAGTETQQRGVNSNAVEDSPEYNDKTVDKRGQSFKKSELQSDAISEKKQPVSNQSSTPNQVSDEELESAEGQQSCGRLHGRPSESAAQIFPVLPVSQQLPFEEPTMMSSDCREAEANKEASQESLAVDSSDVREEIGILLNKQDSQLISGRNEVYPDSQTSPQKVGSEESKVPVRVTSVNSIKEGVFRSSDTVTDTGHLHDIFSSIKSLTDNRPNGAEDTLQIPNSKLMSMWKTIQETQTMQNNIQAFMEKKENHNQQNEVLKGTAVQTNQLLDSGEEKEKPYNLPENGQNMDRQIFCFPPMFDQKSSLADPGSSLQLQRGIMESQHGTGQEMLQTDGDYRSGSLQLSSYLCLDGDQPNITTGNKDMSDTGKNLAFAQGRTNMDAVAAASAQAFTHLHAAACNGKAFLDPLQLQQQGGHLTGNVGVSFKQYELMEDELVKTKELIYKISREGGLHPQNIKELVSLREKVKNLQEENTRLNTEIQNQSGMMRCAQGTPEIQRLKRENEQLQAVLTGRNEQFEQQKKREHVLLEMITKLGAGNKDLKPEHQLASGSRPLSQPSSSVGLQALPTIPATAHAECQTQQSSSNIHTQTLPMNVDQGQLQQEVMSLREKVKIFHEENTRLGTEIRNQSGKTRYLPQGSADPEIQKLQTKVSEQITQMRHMEREYSSAIQKIEEELRARNADYAHLHKQVKSLHQQNADLIKHRDELAIELTNLNLEGDRQKKKLSQVSDRNRHLEETIAGERRRFDRDEKELLDRVRVLTGTVSKEQKLRHLVLALDANRTEGLPLSQDHKEQLAVIHRKKSGGTSSQSARSSSPRAGPSASPAQSSPRAGLSASSNQSNLRAGPSASPVLFNARAGPSASPIQSNPRAGPSASPVRRDLHPSSSSYSPSGNVSASGTNRSSSGRSREGSGHRNQ